MTVELLNLLSLGSFIVAGVFAVVSVCIFFLNDIPSVYGEVSGKTAKKAIEDIKRNSESGKSAYSSNKKKQRGHSYDNVNPNASNNLQNFRAPSAKTEALDLNQNSAEDESLFVPQAGQTTVLNNEEACEGGQTTVLSQNAPVAGQTTVLSQSAPVAGQTSVLINENADADAGFGITTELLAKPDNTVYCEPVADVPFSIEVEMSYTESSEIIE